MSDSDSLQITRRRLPHWRLKGSIYFVTFRCLVRRLSHAERKLVLEHIKQGQQSFYTLYAVVVMPDHVHLLLTPHTGIDLSRIMKGIKGASARKLNQSRGRKGRFWQDESWDRIVRDLDEFEEKVEYMLKNPVKAGLVSDPWRYEGWYFNREAFFGGQGKQECLPHLREPSSSKETLR